MISHYFYPSGIVGAKRMTSLADYLISRGHKVMILKADNHCYGKDIVVEPERENKYETISVSAKSWIGWIWAYRKKIREACSKYTFDNCIISGSPFNYFYNGKFLHQVCNLPYIVDFRDVAAHEIVAPAMDKAYKKMHKKIAFYKTKYIERIVIKHSNISVFTTDKMRDYYTKRYPQYANKFKVIYNGYDGVQLSGVDFSKINVDVLTIGIFGKYTYYGENYANILAEGIKKATSIGIPIKVSQIGRLEEDLKRELDGICDYETLPGMSYVEGMKNISKNWVLLTSNYLIEAVSTKVFDYIFLNHPVLAIVPKLSASEEILSQFENAFFIYDSDSVFDCLKTIWQEKITQLTNEQELIKKYDRCLQNNQFEEYLRMIKKV